MKIIEPTVELITEADLFKRIELCGRVCYKSENKITKGSAEKFVEMAIKRGHTSVLEHSRVWVVNTLDFVGCKLGERVTVDDNPFHDEYITNEQPPIVFKMNMRDLHNLRKDIADYNDTEYNADDYATIRITTDRAIANELVRHRVFSFSQESTRYIKYDDVKFVKPIPFDWAVTERFPEYKLWKNSMKQAEETYKWLVSAGSTPQEARNVLPLSTATELIMTGTYDQWREMLKLRRHKSAHPQMQYVANMIHDLLVKECEFTM